MNCIRTENYNIRLRPDGVKKHIKELAGQFSKRVRYRGLYREWGYIVTEKAYEMAQFIIGKRKSLDFSSPSPTLERQDSDLLRNRILTMSYAQWKNTGMPKSNLHYLKRKAKADKPFRLYGKVREKLTVDYE